MRELKRRYADAPQVVIVLSDGLSTDALLANYEEILPPLLNGLKQAGIRAGERLTSYEPSPAGFDGLRNSFDRVADGLTKILTRHSNYADFQLTRTSGTQYTDKDGTGGGPVKIRTIVGMYFSAARSEAYEKHGNRIEFSVKDAAGKKRKVSLTPIRTTFTEYVW